MTALAEFGSFVTLAGSGSESETVMRNKTFELRRFQFRSIELPRAIRAAQRGLAGSLLARPAPVWSSFTRPADPRAAALLWRGG